MGARRWVRSRFALHVAALLAAAWLLPAPIAHADVRVTAPAPVVIVLSLDGVRHDYLERAAFPAFDRMASEGGRALRHVPVFPSSTFPSHVSMATGAYPDRHGIVANDFLDTQGRRFSKRDAAAWIEAEPIWIAAERQGLRAATYFWVGSETDWRGQRATDRITPFDEEIEDATKVDQILAWLDRPAPSRPALVMAWWHGADRVGHWKGPSHPDILAALVEQDLALARLQAGLDTRGLWPSTTLLLVSDHGMTPASRAIPLEATLEAAGIEATGVFGTAVAHIHLGDPAADLARSVALVDAIEGVDAYARADVPGSLRFAYPGRVGDVVVVAHPPNHLRSESLLDRGVGALIELIGWHRSGHGYAAENPDMAGIFLAMGRGVAAGRRWERIDSVDLAPTISRLLGIEPPRDAEGRPIPGIGGVSPEAAR